MVLNRAGGRCVWNYTPKMSRKRENHHDDDILEAQPKRFISLRKPSLQSWRTVGRPNAVFTRVHSMSDLLLGLPQCQSGKKKHEHFMFFRGNVVTVIAGNTFSDKRMLFSAFLMKNIFINFSTPILSHNFCSIPFKISCFLEANLLVLCEYIMIV